jgi:hypothetical protein
MIVPHLHFVLAFPGPFVTTRAVAPQYPLVRPDAIPSVSSFTIVPIPFCPIARMKERDRIDVAVVILIKIFEIYEVVVLQMVESVPKCFVKIRRPVGIDM